MSYRLSPTEIDFLMQYCTVMKPVTKALNILQSEMNTHGMAASSELPVRSKTRTTASILQVVPTTNQSHSGWCPEALWWDDGRPRANSCSDPSAKIQDHLD